MDWFRSLRLVRSEPKRRRRDSLGSRTGSSGTELEVRRSILTCTQLLGSTQVEAHYLHGRLDRIAPVALFAIHREVVVRVLLPVGSDREVRVQLHAINTVFAQDQVDGLPIITRLHLIHMNCDFVTRELKQVRGVVAVDDVYVLEKELDENLHA